MIFRLKVLIYKLFIPRNKNKNRIKIKFNLVFLAFLLVLLIANWPCFYFRADGLIIGLIVDLVINDVVLITLEIIIGLLKQSL